MMDAKEKFVVSVVPAGGGKTFIILTLALYFRKKFPTSQIHVMTTSKLLVQQLEGDLLPYFEDKSVITISCKTYPTVTESRPVFALIDESDEFVATTPVFVQSTSMMGLHYLKKCTRVFFLTATCTTFLKEITSVLNENKPTKVLEFSSKAEYSGLSQGENSLHSVKVKTKEQALDALVRDLQDTQKLKPMIMF